MIRRAVAGVGVVLLALAVLSLPAAAQGDSISVTPADNLLDGDIVSVEATTTASTFATVTLCPSASAPAVGHDVIDLLRLRSICVGLACFGPEEEVISGLTELVEETCPVALLPGEVIGSVSVDVALPRFTSDGTDCAVDACVVAFNTWNTSTSQGAVGLAVGFQDTEVTTTTVAPLPVVESTTTTTTIELSAPTSLAPPVTAAPTTAPPAPTVPTEVLGAVETNDGQLALTGADPAVFAALGTALLASGVLLTRRSRSGR